jgi:Leucine-rich repeat (LRR) protein
MDGTARAWPQDVDLSDPQTISARRCGLTALPSDGALARLSALETLDLAHNKLSSLPAVLASLPALNLLDVSHNLLEALPVELAAHRSLQMIASHNPLRLELPLLQLHEPLFSDPDFPADERALFRVPSDPPAGHPPVETIRWLRPHEICAAAGDEAPQLFSFRACRGGPPS